MKVLVACEFSGVVRDAFIRKGHSALSCDILPTESPGPHYQGDVFDIINDGWDLMIAHPPCTYLCNSGVRWLYKNGKKGNGFDNKRWANMLSASQFFGKLLNAPIPKICIENPIQHQYCSLPKHNQIIQPWMFGHMETKATCLWLRNLKPLVQTNNVKKEMEKLPKKEKNRTHYLSGKDRGKKRSITFQGIADAMADQWG